MQYLLHLGRKSHSCCSCGAQVAQTHAGLIKLTASSSHEMIHSPAGKKILFCSKSAWPPLRNHKHIKKKAIQWMGHSVGELKDKTHYERPIIVMTSSENAQYIYSSVSHVLHSFSFIFLQVYHSFTFSKSFKWGIRVGMLKADYQFWGLKRWPERLEGQRRTAGDWSPLWRQL